MRYRVGDEMRITEGQLFGERYRLQGEIGRGGMGSVWLARDERLGRDVAVKVMSTRIGNNPDARLRFEREAKAVARVSSPHIVQIHDFGTEPQVFMVMERLRGESLSDRLQGNRTLAPATVIDFVTQCARGLATAHDAGIVHRDLKPGNIFIARERDHDLYKLVDFGIAKAFRGNATLAKITEAGEASGTPKYMSPEQLRAIEDERDDIWSFAVVVYRCLCGRHPFAGASMLDQINGILNCAPTPITSRDQRLPPSLGPLFARAFHKDREARFQSVHEFADAITAALQSKQEPTPAPDLIRHAPTMLSATEEQAAPPYHAIGTVPAGPASGAASFPPAPAANHPLHHAPAAPEKEAVGWPLTLLTFAIAIPLLLFSVGAFILALALLVDDKSSSSVLILFALSVPPAVIALFLTVSWVRHRR